MHFTYTDLDKESHLQQGDLLRIDGRLKEVLQKYHLYYATNKDYKFLIVLTQSCDLVPREPCKAKYINVAAVKPAVMALDKEFSHLRQSEAEEELQLFAKEERHRCRQFVEKLLNNNHSDYFYLEPDASLSFSDPMAAFLKLSIALRTDKHYSKCLENRFGQLRPEFQAKLGWLVGNSYSRVGTSDWLPDKAKKEDWDNRIDSLLGAYVWSAAGAIKMLRKAERRKKAESGGETGLTGSEGRSILEEYRKQKDSRQAVLASTAVDHIKEFIPSIEAGVLDKIRQRLSTASDVRQHLRK